MEISGTHPGIEWESLDTGFVNVDQHTGHLKARLGTSSVGIRAKLPPPYNAKPPRGAIVIPQKSWSLLSTEVKPVGEQPISQSSIDKFPNILFIPDGFKDGEEKLFKKLVKGIIREVAISTSLMPYRSFTNLNMINYWWTFIPSPEWGTSVLRLMTNMILAGPQSIGDEWTEINEDNPPIAKKPDIQSLDKWSLQELIYVVGLPLYFDLLDHEGNQQAYETKLANWINRFNHEDIVTT